MVRLCHTFWMQSARPLFVTIDCCTISVASTVMHPHIAIAPARTLAACMFVWIRFIYSDSSLEMSVWSHTANTKSNSLFFYLFISRSITILWDFVWWCSCAPFAELTQGEFTGVCSTSCEPIITVYACSDGPHERAITLHFCKPYWTFRQLGLDIQVFMQFLYDCVVSSISCLASWAVNLY